MHSMQPCWLLCGSVTCVLSWGQPWNLRKRHLAPVLLPGKFHGQRSLMVLLCPRSHRELDTTEQLSSSSPCTMITFRIRPATVFDSSHVICRVHPEKRWAGRSRSWNQDCREKSQEPQICRWHHPYGRKRRGTEKPLDKGERGEWKSWVKAQPSENKDHGIWSHHFMGNRWEQWKQWQTLFLGAPKSLHIVIAAMKLKDFYSLEGKLWPT